MEPDNGATENFIFSDYKNEIYNHKRNDVKRSFQKIFGNNEVEDTELGTPEKRHRSDSGFSDNLIKYKNNISLENFHITPKSFYKKKSKIYINDSNSSIMKEPPLISNENVSKIQIFIAKGRTSRKNIIFKVSKRDSKEPRLGNKGVSHKIKRPKKISKIVSIDKKDKKNLKKNKYNDTVNINESKIKEPNTILNNDNDSSSEDTDDLLSLSDIENQSQNEISEAQKDENLSFAFKKFFKSKTKPIKNEFEIMRNVKGTVFGGKIFVLSEKQKMKHKIKKSYKFSKERAVVRNIIQKLSDTSEPLLSYENKITKTGTLHSSISNQLEIDQPSSTTVAKNTLHELIDNNFEYFHSLLPYNTNDPEIIERQNLLLDFLISHNICNEENFKIFIADPENHKEKAAQIVDSLAIIVSTRESEDLSQNESKRSHSQCYKTSFVYNNCQETNNIIEKENNTSETFNEIISMNNNLHDSLENIEVEEDRNVRSNSQKLFPIFCDAAKFEVCESNQIKRRPTYLKAHGIDQYQIDAGQKEFGAKQCPQCDLLYSIHEPEEEKIHTEYHQSLQVLRFKGWIDENVVQKYPEWSSDGRIIYITDSSNVKHKKRLIEVIDVVDKELGFSSYIFPNKFVAYLAIKRNQIVGVCLVQPLEKANKYLCVNGVDCCTEEMFDVKCGISRIWVAKPYRRIGIASKLISAVQMCAIPGIQIGLDQIAFSAPTENGKDFAIKVTKKTDFFVY